MAIGVIGVGLAVLVAVMRAAHTGDPLNRFEVLSSIASPDGQRHALIVAYDHANSSSKWNTIFLSDKPGVIGSKERQGRTTALAAAWDGIEIVPVWRDARLLLRVATDIPRRSPSGACLFDESQPLVCFDPEHTEVVH
jgi:hypothetical protein